MNPYQAMFDLLADNFTKKIPFMRQFNLQVERCDAEEVILKFAMDESQLGNFTHKMMHGGAIAAVIDNIGGLSMMVADVVRSDIKTAEQAAQRFAKACTIDLRIDYLLPGKGEFFIAKAKTVRSGNRIQVVRMELWNNENKLIALGAGTFMLG